MVDATPPIEGWVIDGDSRYNDIKFSSDPASIRVTYGDFIDPESAILAYVLEVYRKHDGTYHIIILITVKDT